MQRAAPERSPADLIALVDELIAAYVTWRTECSAVTRAYGALEHGRPPPRGRRFRRLHCGAGPRGTGGNHLPECPGADHDTGDRAAGLRTAARAGCAPRISRNRPVERAEHRAQTRTVKRRSSPPRPRLGPADAPALSRAARKPAGTGRRKRRPRLAAMTPSAAGITARTRMHGCRDRNGSASVADPLATRPARTATVTSNARTPTRRDTQQCGKSPAGWLTEQIVDAGRVNPAPATGCGCIGKAEHRPSQRRSLCRHPVDGALVGAQLSQRLLTFDEEPEFGEKEQRVGEHAAGGESQRVAAPRVVAFVSQDRVEGGLIEERDGAGRHIHSRSQQARAERARLRVGNHHRAPQGLELPTRDGASKTPGGARLADRAPEGSDRHDRSQCRQEQDHDGVDVGRGVAEALPENLDPVRGRARADPPRLHQPDEDEDR